MWRTGLLTGNRLVLNADWCIASITLIFSVCVSLQPIARLIFSIFLITHFVSFSEIKFSFPSEYCRIRSEGHFLQCGVPKEKLTLFYKKMWLRPTTSHIITPQERSKLQKLREIEKATYSSLNLHCKRWTDCVCVCERERQLCAWGSDLHFLTTSWSELQRERLIKQLLIRLAC